MKDNIAQAQQCREPYYKSWRLWFSKYRMERLFKKLIYKILYYEYIVEKGQSLFIHNRFTRKKVLLMYWNYADEVDYRYLKKNTLLQRFDLLDEQMCP